MVSAALRFAFFSLFVSVSLTRALRSWCRFGGMEGTTPYRGPLSWSRRVRHVHRIDGGDWRYCFQPPLTPEGSKYTDERLQARASAALQALQRTHADACPLSQCLLVDIFK